MVLEINPDAIDIARQLDAERERGIVRRYARCVHPRYSTSITPRCSALHGLPVLVKDMIGTHDKMQTSGKPFGHCVYSENLGYANVCSSWILRSCRRANPRRRHGRYEAPTEGSHHTREDQHVGMGKCPVDELVQRVERTRGLDICGVLPPARPQWKLEWEWCGGRLGTGSGRSGYGGTYIPRPS
jgi:hypothetical protein